MRFVAGGRQRFGSHEPPFLPTQVSAVSTWLRFANGTSDVNGFSSVPDILNSNPAVQSVDANKPARVLSANGFPMADFGGDDRLSWPLIAANNGTVTTGFMFWIVPDDVTGDERMITMWVSGDSTDVRKCIFEKTGAKLRLYVRNGAADPQCITGDVLAIGVPACVGFEFNGAGATDADKCVITFNGVAVASTNGTLPAAMNVCTGSANIGAYNQGTLHYSGLLGPNLFGFGSAMAGVTSGLLTPDARTALYNFERPTV